MRTFAPLNQFFLCFNYKVFPLQGGGACNLPPTFEKYLHSPYIFLQTKEANALKSGTSLKPCAVFLLPLPYIQNKP